MARDTCAASKRLGDQGYYRDAVDYVTPNVDRMPNAAHR